MILVLTSCLVSLGTDYKINQILIFLNPVQRFLLIPRKVSKMLNLSATVVNVFQTNEFKDKKTGEITPAGHKAQLQYSEPVNGGGEKIVLKDFNIHDLGEQYKKVLGKLVTVPVGVWVDQETRKPGLYIPKGGLPTVHGSSK